MSQISTAAPLKLNLGSGQNPIQGYVNVDRFGSPDFKWDLEQFPWPWADSSVDEIVLNHVLEHLGEQVPTFFAIIKELYRISKHGAQVNIVVPHPRHDDFLGDPTHVRAFTPESFQLYSKAKCREWQEGKFANTPLALYLDVDFNVTNVQLVLEQPWSAQFEAKKITPEQVSLAARQFNNVVKEVRVRWVVNKP